MRHKSRRQIDSGTGDRGGGDVGRAGSRLNAHPGRRSARPGPLWPEELLLIDRYRRAADHHIGRPDLFVRKSAAPRASRGRTCEAVAARPLAHDAGAAVVARLQSCLRCRARSPPAAPASISQISGWVPVSRHKQRFGKGEQARHQARSAASSTAVAAAWRRSG